MHCVDLVLAWHMHQPDYRDSATGEFRLPWVYLHAIKGYSDMAGHLERHPGVRVVVNFVPVLLDQLSDYAAQFASGALRDPLLRLLARSEATALSRAERSFAIELCFHATTNGWSSVSRLPPSARSVSTLERHGERAQYPSTASSTTRWSGTTSHGPARRCAASPGRLRA